MQEELGLIAVVHKLLKPVPVTNQSLDISLVALSHFLVLFLGMAHLVLHPKNLLYYFICTCFWFYISASSLRLYIVGSSLY